MNDRPVARRFFISGMVQGVGYRFFAQRVAAQLGLGGYTKNLRDGRVEVYAIGPKSALAQLRSQLERGPESASVADIAEEEATIDAKFEENFSIEYER